MKKKLEALKLDKLSNLLKNDLLINNKAKISKSELDLIKKSNFFSHLKLNEREIYLNILNLRKIMLQEEKCSSLENECINDSNYHLGVRRYKNNIYFYYFPCEKMNKIFNENKYKNNYLYNYYDNADISNSQLSLKFISGKVDPTKNIIINKFKNNASSNSSYGLYIYGKCGVGKTFLCFCFSNAYAQRKNKTICFVYTPEMVNIIKLGFNNVIEKEKSSKLIQNMKDCDVLVLDDLGSEFATDWFYSDYLLNILNIRVNLKKITLFNSNYSIDKLEKVIANRCKGNDKDILAQRIIDRIRQLVNNEFLQLNGKNMRY